MKEKNIIQQNCLFLFIKGLLNHENFVFILKPQEFICYQTLTKLHYESLYLTNL